MISSTSSVGVVGPERSKHSKHPLALRLFYYTVIAIVGAALLPVIPAAAKSPAVPAPQVSSAPSAYFAVNPTRVMDTRTGSGIVGAGNTLGPGASFSLVVAPNTTAGVPANATAVVMNVTVTNTTAASYLTVYPTLASLPFASNLNWVAGYTVPNLVTVQPGSGGAVTFYNKFGSVDVIADIAGYYAPPSGSAGGEVATGFPKRLVDTRAGSGFQGAGSALGPAATASYQVTGKAGVPATGVSAVIVNATVTNTTAASFLTLWAGAPTTMNKVSNANWVAGWTRANRAIVPVSSTGMISVYNQFGSVDVILDVNGYYTDSTASGNLFTSVSPIRLADHTAVGPNSSFNLSIGGVAGVPLTASAVVLDAVTSETTAASFLTVAPSPGAGAATSDINWVAGQVNPNLTVTTLGTGGQANFYNSAGNANVSVDLEGFFGAGASVVVTANPTSVPADGTTTSTLSAKVTKADGTAAVGDQVAFSAGGASPAGACGTITGSPAITDGTGTATLTNGYTASTTAGTCTITATEAANNISGTAMITQTVIKNSTAQAPAQMTILASTAAPPFTITTTVTNNGNPVSGDTVTWTKVPSITGSCGTLSAASAPTSAGGVATTDYTASNVVGFCTVTGTESADGSSASTLVTQRGTSPTSSTLTANPTSLAANGTSTSTVTFTVSGVGSGSDPVNFFLTPSVSGACGALSGVPATTNASGVATATYTSSTKAGICAVTASEANGGTTQSTPITQTRVNIVTVSAAPSTLPADGTTTSTVTATVIDSVSNQPVAADGVLFSLTGCGSGAITTTNPTTTNASGVATVTYRASTSPSSCTVGAIESATSQTGSTTIVQTANIAAAVAVTASKSSIQADGTSTSTISATVTNASGGPVVGDTVNFTGSPSVAGACGTLSAGTPTDVSGVSTSTYTASTTVGTCTITATELTAGKSGSTAVTQTVVKNVIAQAPAQQAVPADGATTFAIADAVTNNGAPVASDVVTWTGTASATGSCGTTTPASLATNAGGTAGTVYKASLVVGFCTVTGTEAGNGSSASTLVLQRGSSIGTATSVAASKTSIPADGATTSVLTVTITGPGAALDPVAFLLTPSTAGACGTMPAFATSNTSGVATATYTASTTAGSCAIVAIEANGGSSGAVAITQNPVPNVITGSASPNAIKGDGITTSALTVHVTSGVTGANVASDPLIFTVITPGCGTISSPSASTNASGTGTATYTSSVNVGGIAHFCTVRVGESGTAQTVDIVIDQTA